MPQLKRYFGVFDEDFGVMHNTARDSDRFYGYKLIGREFNYGYGGRVDAVAFVLAMVKAVNKKARLWMLKSDNVADKNEIFMFGIFNKKYPRDVYKYKVPTDQMLKATPGDIDAASSSETQEWGADDNDDQSDGDDDTPEMRFPLDGVGEEDEDEDVREVAIPEMSQTLIEDDPGELGFGEEPADESSFYYDLGVWPFFVDQHIKKGQQITFQEIVIENPSHLSGRIEISGEANVVDDEGNLIERQKIVFLGVNMHRVTPTIKRTISATYFFGADAMFMAVMEESFVCSVSGIITEIESFSEESSES